MKLSHKIFAAFLTAFIAISCALAEEKPYVILVSFDGFRYDYDDRGITPNIDSLKARGVSALSLKPVFPSSTFPNHLAIITGLYAENHGIIANNFYDSVADKTYRIGAEKEVRDAYWYRGEAFWETAERRGIKTACYFWPGSELKLDYRRPTYYEKYDHDRPYEKRIEGVIDWLQMPENKRPHFITLYFHETDSEGHDSGTQGDKINAAIAKLDAELGKLVKDIEEIGMRDEVNIILISDHGMTDLDESRIVNISPAIGERDCRIQNYGSMAMIEPEYEFETKQIYDDLKAAESHYKVYLKEDIPEYLHFSKNNNISSIFVLADLGWILTEGDGKMPYSLAGAHGFDNNEIEMQGIFFAAGPAFKENYRIGTVENVDIYPLLCRIFGFEAPSDIDGRIERIECVLKEK